MSKNRRKNGNSIEISTFAKWGVIFTVIAVIGVSYVSMKNRLHQYGEQRRTLERELTVLRETNRAMASQIVILCSRDALQQKLDSGFIQMIPIPDDRIVRLEMNPQRSPSAELQAVSNQMGF